MPQIIKDGAIVEDAWRQGKRTIFPLQSYLEQAARLAASGECVGVLLGPDDEPELLLPYLDQLPLIAINFPSFADGRGYSTGRLLRSRHGFTGELRAVGDILRDQLYFLCRCGFNAFELREDQNLHAALAAFGDYAWQPNSRLRAVTEQG